MELIKLKEGDAWLAGRCRVYNWNELAGKYGIEANTNAELAFKLLLKKGIRVLDEFRGPYALAFHDRKTYLVRDRVGIFPLFHSGASFSDRRKPGMRELHPRQIWVNGELKHRGGFKVKASSLRDLEKSLRESVRLRLHEDTTLFLSGVDSALLGCYLKDEGADFRCISVGLKGSPDLKRAKKISEALRVKWEGIEVDKGEALKAVGKVVGLIDSSDPVKVEVGLVMHFASRGAGEVAFSGLGADELFGGYARMHRSPDKEALWALLNVYERSTYAGYAVGLANGTEVRVPYLDSAVVELALGLPAEMKREKRAIRELLYPYVKELAASPKKAAQYGSHFAKVIPKPKHEYLKRLVRSHRKLAALISGGKDSWYALYTVKKLNYEVACAIVMIPEREDSWMFHVPEVKKAAELLRARKIPVIEAETSGKKEKELDDLGKALSRTVKQYGVEGIVSGAISSEYQRHRIELLADRIGLSCHAPLWGVDQKTYLRRLLRDGFKFKIVSVAADGLGTKWLGKTLDKGDVELLINLSEKYKFNPAGEGGEYETFVVDAPAF